MTDADVRFDYTPDEAIPAFTKEFRAKFLRASFPGDMAENPAWWCRCCRKFTGPDYHVSDAVWASAAIAHKAGLVCLPCLDDRLTHRRGSSLMSHDLSNAPVNDALHYAIRVIGPRQAQERPEA